MATTSTVLAAWRALASTVDTGELAGKVHFAWPGPRAKGAKEIAWVDDITDYTSTIPTIKAGRKQRQESYVLELVLWVTRPQGDNAPAAAEATLGRALDLWAVVEGALADDVQLGEAGVQHFELAEVLLDMVPFEQSWGCQIVGRIDVEARLT